MKGKRIRAGSGFREALERGDMFLEDLPPDLIERLRKLLGRRGEKAATEPCVASIRSRLEEVPA